MDLWHIFSLYVSQNTAFACLFIWFQTIDLSLSAGQFVKILQNPTFKDFFFQLVVNGTKMSRQTAFHFQEHIESGLLTSLETSGQLAKSVICISRTQCVTERICFLDSVDVQKSQHREGCLLNNYNATQFSFPLLLLAPLLKLMKESLSGHQIPLIKLQSDLISQRSLVYMWVFFSVIFKSENSGTL